VVWLWISERKLSVCAFYTTKCSWRVAGETWWEMKVSVYWELVVLGCRSGGCQTPENTNLCIIAYCFEDTLPFDISYVKM